MPIPIAQTSLNLSTRQPADAIALQAEALFKPSPSGTTSPVFVEQRPHGEFDVSRDHQKFVAGWPCVQMLSGSDEFAAREQRVSPAPLFFSAANPADSSTRELFARAYASHSHDNQSIRKEIGQAALAAAQQEAVRMDARVPAEQVRLQQAYRIDTTTGQGVPYLHGRDAPHAALLDQGNSPIHTFLPGYATGDRYSLILATLINPRLHVSLAYTRGNAQERASAEEAAGVIRSALTATGQADAATRVSLYVYDGPSLKGARETLDEAATRQCFQRVDGPASALSEPGGQGATHLFHISVTTELIARSFRDSTLPAEERFASIRAQLVALVDPTDRTAIDGLVDTVIAEQNIQPGAAALWIADREFANAREAEAISRPMMFEQIAQALNAAGTPVYCIADTYINRARDAHGVDRMTDRHPWRPTLHPHIGRFWAAEHEGRRILAPRENQWYFMQRLLEQVGGPVIGIRSGALEPFALMGHQVIYLEHKDMFTPERHACWQDIIPYHRMVTTHTTGYLDKHTETFRSNERQRLLSANLALRQQLGAPGTGPRGVALDELRAAAADSPARQAMLGRVDDDLREGVLAGNELKLLVAMVGSRATAWETANLPGVFST